MPENKFAEIMEAVNKRYKGKYTAIASDTNAFKMERIPTGILAVDGITYGGIPKRRIVIFWGTWSSAKTFTALKTCARAQRTCRSCNSFMEHKGTKRTVIDQETGEILMEGAPADGFLSKIADFEELESRKNTSSEGELDEAGERELKALKTWVTKSGMKGKQFRTDEERNLLCPKCGCTEGLTPVWTAIEEFDQSFATMAGVDLSKLYVIRSEYAEQAIDISAEFMRTGKCDLMVIDSIAMMAPSKEIEESAEKWQQGLMARIMNKALRRWAAGQTVLDVEGGENVAVPTLILINQVREKIGVIYGSPDVLPGGKGQGFANSLLLKFRGGQFGKSEDKTITFNQQIWVKVEKSKVCPPHESGDYVLWLREHKGNYPGTTSEPKVVLEAGLVEGIIIRDKNSYTLEGKKHTSQKSVLADLTEDDMLLDRVRTQILDRMNEKRLRHA